MGGLYQLADSNPDKISVLEAKPIYLTTSAANFYIQNTTLKLTLLKEYPDAIINIFNLAGAVTAQEGATYQQLIQFARVNGATDEESVKFALANVGISKQNMLDRIDWFQSDIIAQREAQLKAAEAAIKTQVTTQTFQELDLQKQVFDIKQPTTIQQTQTPISQTKGDISSGFLDFFNTITNPVKQTPTTIEIPKQDIIKAPTSFQSIDMSTAQTIKKENFFVKNQDVLIVGLVVTSTFVVLGLVAKYSYKKKN